jgi:hypothetical protein
MTLRQVHPHTPGDTQTVYEAGLRAHAENAHAETGELTLREECELSIAMIEAAAERCAQAHADVQRLEDARAELKAQCIAEMIGKPDPLKVGGVHSASSAEKIVEIHPRYAAHRQLQNEAEVERWRALGQYAAAQRRADLDLILFRASQERGA